MTYHVQIMPSEMIQQLWPMLEPFARKMVESDNHAFPNYSMDHILGYITSGQWLLIVAVDEGNIIQGAMTIAFENYPYHRVALITGVSGKGVLNRDTLQQLTSIVKAKGATKIQAYGKPSIARLHRLLGFSEIATLTELVL